MTTKPKILLFDIETAPMSGYVWGLWQQNVSYDKQLITDWYMLCYAAKWIDKKVIKTDALPRHTKLYKKDAENDREVVKSLWKLLDEADIVITHNGNRFDIKKVQERFEYHGLPPTSPFKSIDTLSAARRHFAFTSNKMDSIATRLGLPNKMSHSGFQLWKDCIHGKRSAWKTMVDYNKQDIIVLEELYLRFRPWMTSHPSLAVYQPDKKLCPCCGGSSLEVQESKYRTDSFTYDLHKCTDCGAYSRDRTNIESKGAKFPLRNINRR